MYVVTEKCTIFSLKSVPLERRGYYMYFICTCGENNQRISKKMNLRHNYLDHNYYKDS